MKYVEVILPLPLSGTFTYKVPDHIYCDIGFRVIVPLGKRKIYTGIIHRFRDSDDGEFLKKEVLDVLDESPIVNSFQLRLIEWMAGYYLCSLGEAYNACVPAGLKLTSESYISLHPDTDPDSFTLSDKEEVVITWLREKDLTFSDVGDITNLAHPYRIIKSLTDKNLITVYEKLKDRYTSKKEARIRLSEDALSGLDEIAARLEGRQKQYELLMTYLQEVPVFDDPESNKAGISRKSLLSNDVSYSSLKTLLKKGFFEEWDEIIDRFSYNNDKLQTLSPLSGEQEKVLSEIKSQFASDKVALLRGVTGSGKTEIYMYLIRQVIDQGKQALLLLPEIAITTQIIKRFRSYFGDSFGVYHSRFSDNERVEVYKSLRDGKISFIIGVRSAIFLPYTDLGLVIVDEEHENSYKQFDPAPRYHARDSAIVLSTLHKANALLGSATPSLESVQNVKEQKYGLSLLLRRFNDQPQPTFRFIDMHQARKKRKLKGNFSLELLEAIQDCLSREKQIILFHNRRGYSPYIQCDNCRDIPQCPNCDVSLTYHIYRNELICHYCGHHYHLDSQCTACQSTELRTVGTGTEKIEEELALLIPDVKIQRMDLDTTRHKNAYQQIIDDFEAGDTQILVGTQMVSKGLDFEKVELVGIVDTDRLLHFPDFRSHERAFQMITQVSGRAGRKHEQGTVILQTSYPDHPVLQAIKNDKASEFIQEELKERYNFRYPPFYRMITITLRAKESAACWSAARELVAWCSRDLSPERVLGPVSAPVGRIRNFYLVQVHIKIEKKGVNLAAIKQYLRSSKDTLVALPSFKGIQIQFDVDPV